MLFGLGCVGLGVSSSPLFLMATAINPAIVPAAIGKINNFMENI